MLEEAPFVVVYQKTDEDITRSILLQIIFEQEFETNSLLLNDNLERFIRFYNAGTYLGFSDFTGQGMTFFKQQHREFSKAMEGMASHNPMTF